MNEITLSFTPHELKELAKQLYLASYFLNMTEYDNQRMVDEITTRVCAKGFLEARETGGFRHGGLGETAFMVSMDVDHECTPLVELFEDHAVKEHLPYTLADRDFEEEYGFMEAEELLKNHALLKALHDIQNKYLQEFERYGATHLRLQKKQ